MIAAPHLRLVEPTADERGYLSVATTLIRNFLGMPVDEPTELAFFERGKRIHVAHAMSAESHVRLLRNGQALARFEAAYMLANGPIVAPVLHRYPHDQVCWADNERVKDSEIAARRAVYIDVDVVRAKGISSTNDEMRAACDVADTLEAWLGSEIGTPTAIGRGCSGNGYFFLVAIEPRAVVPEDAVRISRFLGLLAKKFDASNVKIDGSVFNAARLMPAPGTWKCKGTNTPQRPHRQTTFCSRGDVTRVPLEVLC